MAQEFRERLRKCRDIYIKNLKEKQQWYHMPNEEISYAIKFIQLFEEYVEWTMTYDGIEVE